jgi:hypothetical protein
MKFGLENKHVYDIFQVQKVMKQEDALSRPEFQLCKCSISTVKETMRMLKLRGTQQLLVKADDVNLLRENTGATENREEDSVLAGY